MFGILGSRIAANSVPTIPTTTTHKVIVTNKVTHWVSLFSIFHAHYFFQCPTTEICANNQHNHLSKQFYVCLFYI